MAEAHQIPLSLMAPLVRVSCETLEQAWQRRKVRWVDSVNNHRLSDPYQFSWQSALNEYRGHKKSPFSPESAASQGRLNVERLLHTALVSGQLTSDSEQVIEQAFGGKDFTDREIELLVTLKDAISVGAVKQITSSKQAANTISKSPYRIFCSLPQT